MWPEKALNDTIIQYQLSHARVFFMTHIYFDGPDYYKINISTTTATTTSTTTTIKFDNSVIGPQMHKHTLIS